MGMDIENYWLWTFLVILAARLVGTFLEWLIAEIRNRHLSKFKSAVDSDIQSLKKFEFAIDSQIQSLKNRQII